MKELYSNGSASSIQRSSLFQLSQSILFLLLLSLLLLVFFVPFPTLNEKVKPNKKEAKCYNPNGGKIPEKDCKKNIKWNTQCTIS